MIPFSFIAAERHIRHRPLGWLINLLMVTLGVGVLSFLSLGNRAIDNQLKRNLSGIDMVVASKGSPLQALLCTVFHLDVPTGNIAYSMVDSLSREPMVASIIPISMGDSYHEFRIVGTDESYLQEFGLILDEGRVFGSSREVVIGSEVAQNLDLHLGDKFESNHGVSSDPVSSHEHPLRVVGILQQSGLVADRSILTPLSTYWELHHVPEKSEITALFVQFTNPTGMFQLPRKVNMRTKEMAVLPAIEVNKIRQLSSVSSKWLGIFSIVILVFSILNMFLLMIRELEARLPVLSMLTAMGLDSWGRFKLILFEVAITLVTGWGLGVFIAHTIFIFPSVIGFQGVQTELIALQPIEAILLLGLLIISVFISWAGHLGTRNFSLTKRL